MSRMLRPRPVADLTPVIGFTPEPVPLEYDEWRLVDDKGNEVGRARLDEPIIARVASSTPLFAEYPR